MRTAGGIYCAAIDCHNNRKKHKHLSFFTFPKNEERSKQWIANIGREDLQRKSGADLYKKLYLCTDHFEDSMFMNKDKKKIVWNAVPTIFFGKNTSKRRRKLRRPLVRRQQIETKEIAETLPKTTVEAETFLTITTEGNGVVNVNSEHSYCKEPSVSVASKEPSQPVVDEPLISQAVESVLSPAPVQCILASVPVPFEVQRVDTLGVAPFIIYTSMEDNIPKRGRRKLQVTPETENLKSKIRKQCQMISKLKRKYLLLKDNSKKKDCSCGSPSEMTVDGIIEASAQFLPQCILDVFSAQLKAFASKNKLQHWNPNMKKFSLALYQQSRKTYKFLGSIFKLPSETVIQRFMGKIRNETRLDEEMISASVEKLEEVDAIESLCSVYNMDEETNET